MELATWPRGTSLIDGRWRGAQDCAVASRDAASRSKSHDENFGAGACRRSCSTSACTTLLRKAMLSGATTIWWPPVRRGSLRFFAATLIAAASAGQPVSEAAAGRVQLDDPAQSACRAQTVSCSHLTWHVSARACARVACCM